MNTLRRLLRLIAPFRRWIVAAVVLSFLTIGSSIALMATSAYLISRAAIASDIVALSLAITGVRLFAILRAVFRYLERFISHRTTFQILAHLRVWFYSAIEPLAPARLSHYRSGDLLARSVADVDTLENFYVRVVVPPISAALAVGFACAILGVFAVPLALVLLAYLLTTGLALPLILHQMGRRVAAEIISLRADLSAALVDNVQGGAELLLFDQAEDHHKHGQSLSREINLRQERMALLGGVGNAAAALFATLAALSVLWFAIPLVTGGTIDGVYLALLPLTAIASFEAVQPLPMALEQLGANQEAGKRLFALIDAPPDIIEPNRPLPMPSDLSIELRDVRFRYNPGDPLALDGICLKLPMGSCTAVAGASGAGKSTMVNLLLRYWDYESGSITIGGCDLRSIPSDDVRSRIGVVPQNIYLFNTTLRDNLLIAKPDATDPQIVEACQQALVHDFIEGLPEGYNTVIGENGLLLSGGERQQLALARAILKGAPILILDEPTANLDARTERGLINSLRPFLANRTTLIFSHRAAALEPAEQIVTLEHGRVVNRKFQRAWLRVDADSAATADASG